MEATVQSSKPATTQDAVLGLVSSSRNQEDGEQFDKVFEEASQRLESENSDSSKRVEEDEDKVKKENKPTQKNANEMDSTEGLSRSSEIITSILCLSSIEWRLYRDCKGPSSPVSIPVIHSS